jgi:hypothetical protein
MGVRFPAVSTSDRRGKGAPPSQSFAPKEVARLFGSDVIFVPGSTATVLAEWHGKLVEFTAECTVTIPSGLPVDFACGWSQGSAAAVTFVAGAGLTLQSFEGNLVSSGQYAMGGIIGMAAGPFRVYGQLVAA